MKYVLTCRCLLQGCLQYYTPLQSIHPDCLSVGSSKDTIKLEVPVELPESTVVYVVKVHRRDGEPSNPPEAQGVTLKTLPPVLLDICLPSAYPFVPPEIRTIHVTQSWLSFTSELCDHLLAKWEKGDGVLYTWVEWIRSGEFLEELVMVSNESGRRVVRYVIMIPAPLRHSSMHRTVSRTLTLNSCSRHWGTTTTLLRPRGSHRTHSNAKCA